MSLGNPHQTTANLGDLVVVVTANGKHTNETGMRLWFECEVATVVGVDKARRIKAVLFARSWSVERRASVANLVALVPFPADQIDVPLAMMATRKHGKPFGSLEEVRAAVRPFVLVDLIERGYNPAVGEPAPSDTEEADPATEAFVDVADAERYAQCDEYVNADDPEAAPACARCKIPFDPEDKSYTGSAQHDDTPYCEGCVDNCHEAGADHRCVICAPRNAEGGS